MRLHRRALALSVLLAASLCTYAQSPSDLTRIYSESDSQLPLPVHPTRNGQDASAIQQLAGFMKATNLSGWTGLIATGTITIAGDPVPYPAHFSVAGGNSYRLDVEKPDGTDSTIVNGTQGVFVAPQRQSRAMSSDTAFGGLLALPRVLASGYPFATSSVLDEGLVSNGDVSLHRITFDDAASLSDSCSPWKTVDLYFNPATNLLVSTAINGRMNSDDRACYLLLTTYGDYQTVAGASFPFSISQSLNGQPQWELKLTSVTLSAPSDTSIFNF